MKNETLIEFIKEKYYELELEKKFTKDFSKYKWREYFNLDLAIGELHSIEIEQIIDFVIKFLHNN